MILNNKLNCKRIFKLKQIPTSNLVACTSQNPLVLFENTICEAVRRAARDPLLKTPACRLFYKRKNEVVSEGLRKHTTQIQSSDSSIEVGKKPFPARGLGTTYHLRLSMCFEWFESFQKSVTNNFGTIRR